MSGAVRQQSARGSRCSILWPQPKVNECNRHDYDSCGNPRFASKVFAVKTALGVTSLLLTADLCGSQSIPKQCPAWCFPDDTKAIRSQEPPKPYTAKGLPEGTVSVLTKYRPPGLRARRPGGRGYWEFESVAKLFYHAKQFAIVGTATGVNESRDGYLGWVTSMVIYDEDGDGKFESTAEMNAGNSPFVFHLPSWVTRWLVKHRHNTNHELTPICGSVRSRDLI